MPYDIALGSCSTCCYGKKIPLPGGPGRSQRRVQRHLHQLPPGAVPDRGSSYIQDVFVTWTSGDPCPEAATLLTYSESDNPASPHYADQTDLFSHRQWATAYFCPLR